MAAILSRPQCVNSVCVHIWRGQYTRNGKVLVLGRKQGFKNSKIWGKFKTIVHVLSGPTADSAKLSVVTNKQLRDAVLRVTDT